MDRSARATGRGKWASRLVGCQYLWRRLAVLVMLAAVTLPSDAQPPGRDRPGGGNAAPANQTQPENQSQDAKSADENQKQDEGQKKEGEDKDKDKSEEDDASIKRPSKPIRVPDPREFDVQPDDSQRVQFSFHGQMWPDVMQWLASISGLSLDWQELPNDFIHISTDRPYSIDQTRDLFNRLLFERGYTIVQQGNVMIVVKISKLDPSLLPRVEDESQLMDLPAHRFVKITFRLPDKLKADQAAADVKPLLTVHAKVQPLMATNRLLIVDLVGNLRDVSRLINAEHAAAVSDVVPREFKLRFARADLVADQVMILLGLDPSSRRTPQELQVEQQRLQLFAQMQQKGKDVTKYLRKGDAPTVFLSVNHRNNSIVVNAPRDSMQIIERAITLLDIPSGAQAGLSSAADLSLVRYQLVTLKPVSIVTALQDIGDLDPRTRLRTDSDAKTVFANATQADHAKIRAMIDRLDGSGRQFEVIWLRRLPADAVAATVHSLMVGQDEDKDENQGRYWGYWRSRSQEDEDHPNKGFRIEPDVENNRLLLWANADELTEVRKLLVKLGELPGDSGNPNRVRVLERRSVEQTSQLLRQLQRLWPNVAPNELRIDAADPADSDGTGQPVPQKSDADVKKPTEADARRAAANLSAGNRLRRAHQVALLPVQLTADQPRETAAREAPPINITVNADGQLVISSRDTAALDVLEDLIRQVAARPKNYEVFYLRHASASLVTLNLEEYFADDLDATDGGSDDDYWRGWYGWGPASDKKDDVKPGLNRRRQLRFIYDFDTNSILVSNASPEQLATVRSLIEVYDRPLSEESISARRFQIFKIKYTQASVVANTIKDVYRDLLSSKDKVFDRGKGEKEQTSQTTNYYRIYGGSDDDKKPKKVKASFAGALSVGVDEVSNTLIISAQEEWMPSIAEMIEYLDQAAEPVADTIRVVNTKIDPAALQRALQGTMSSQRARQQQQPDDQQRQRPEEPPTPREPD